MTRNTSFRTEIRDLIVDELRAIDSGDKSDNWFTKPNILLYWPEVEEVAAWPSLSVIVTDEEHERETMTSELVTVTIKIAGYAKDDKDPRQALDQLIEDMTRKLNNNAALRTYFREYFLQTIVTDEGTKAAQPYGHFIATWSAKFARQSWFSG